MPARGSRPARATVSWISRPARESGPLSARFPAWPDTPTTSRCRTSSRTPRTPFPWPGSARPRHGVLGEEFGVTAAADGPGTRQWVIDPIDGTKNFIRGVPIWATLIALMEGDQAMVGMVSAPALGRRWWAARGHRAFAGRHRAAATPIRVSGVSRLSDASFCYSDLREWEEAGRLSGMLDIIRRTWRNRSYGDFYGYMLVAEGAVDVMVEPELSLWDLAALVPIVTEAGGTFTDLAGRPGPGGGSAVATNGKLHADILDRLGHTR